MLAENIQFVNETHKKNIQTTKKVLIYFKITTISKKRGTHSVPLIHKFKYKHHHSSNIFYFFKISSKFFLKEISS